MLDTRFTCAIVQTQHRSGDNSRSGYLSLDMGYHYPEGRHHFQLSSSCLDQSWPSPWQVGSAVLSWKSMLEAQLFQFFQEFGKYLEIPYSLQSRAQSFGRYTPGPEESGCNPGSANQQLCYFGQLSKLQGFHLKNGEVTYCQGCCED